LRSIYAAHDGVYAMSTSIPDLVETSNNIARVQVKDGLFKISCLTRSSVNSAKMDLAHALKSSFELPNSEILEVLKSKYESMFEEKPRVVACHAGLECGILGQNYPDMDMVSFGPTIHGAHSPDERVQISSVQKFWEFLKIKVDLKLYFLQFHIWSCLRVLSILIITTFSFGYGKDKRVNWN